LFSNVGGSGTVAIGRDAMRYANSDPNTFITYNTAIGFEALRGSTDSSLNTGVGNTAIGYASMLNNEDGIGNTAIGQNSLLSNISGGSNVSIGRNSLQANESGNENTAIGDGALYYNTTGKENTSLGQGSLFNNIQGNRSVAVGMDALINTNSDENTSVGTHSGLAVMSGIRNTFLGYGADLGEPGNSNAVDWGTISYSTALGYFARVSTSNTMTFGGTTVNKWAFGLPTTDSGKALQVGRDTTTGNGAYLSDGGTWTNASSILLKTNFIELEDSWILEKIRSLDIFKWDYKNTSETHIGPTSEQFLEAFDVGLQNDKTHLSTIDVSGVALKGVQVLIDKIESQENQISSLKYEIELLKELIAEIKSN